MTIQVAITVTARRCIIVQTTHDDPFLLIHILLHYLGPHKQWEPLRPISWQSSSAEGSYISDRWIRPRRHRCTDDIVKALYTTIPVLLSLYKTITTTVVLPYDESIAIGEPQTISCTVD